MIMAYNVYTRNLTLLAYFIQKWISENYFSGTCLCKLPATLSLVKKQLIGELSWIERELRSAPFINKMLSYRRETALQGAL